MTRSRQTADWGSRAGLAKIVPSSVAVGSGTGSADTTGNVTFSGASSVSLNDVFSATYDNYRLVIDYTGSAQNSFTMRLRVSGSDNSTSNYQRQALYAASTTVGGAKTSNGTSWSVGGIFDNSARCNLILDLTNPFLTTNTGAVAFESENYNQSANLQLTLFALGFSATTSFTGFSLIPNTGTITGTVRVYGYTQ